MPSKNFVQTILIYQNWYPRVSDHQHFKWKVPEIYLLKSFSSYKSESRNLKISIWTRPLANSFKLRTLLSKSSEMGSAACPFFHSTICRVHCVFCVSLITVSYMPLNTYIAVCISTHVGVFSSQKKGLYNKNSIALEQ